MFTFNPLLLQPLEGGVGPSVIMLIVLTHSPSLVCPHIDIYMVYYTYTLFMGPMATLVFVLSLSLNIL